MRLLRRSGWLLMLLVALISGRFRRGLKCVRNGSRLRRPLSRSRLPLSLLTGAGNARRNPIGRGSAIRLRFRIPFPCKGRRIGTGAMLGIVFGSNLLQHRLAERLRKRRGRKRQGVVFRLCLRRLALSLPLLRLGRSERFSVLPVLLSRGRGMFRTLFRIGRTTPVFLNLLINQAGWDPVGLFERLPGRRRHRGEVLVIARLLRGFRSLPPGLRGPGGRSWRLWSALIT